MTQWGFVIGVPGVADTVSDCFVQSKRLQTVGLVPPSEKTSGRETGDMSRLLLGPDVLGIAAAESPSLRHAMWPVRTAFTGDVGRSERALKRTGLNLDTAASLISKELSLRTLGGVQPHSSEDCMAASIKGGDRPTDFIAGSVVGLAGFA